MALPFPRGGAAVALVNGATVVAGGKTTGAANAVVAITPTSSTWAADPNVNGGRVGPGFVSTPTGILYYGGGGGTNGTNASNSAFLYDITGANGNDAPSMISARAQFASATDATAQAYAIGGVSDQGTNLATVERFNATSNSWTTLTAMPASRSGAGAAFDGTGSIYVVGGSATVSGTSGTNTLYKYTVSTNTWTTLAALPINIRDAAVVFAPDGKLDVIGGISNGVTVASVETYDPVANTWAGNTALPAAVSSAAAVVDSLGRVDVIGGFNATKQPVSAVTVSQIVKNAVAAPVFTSTPSTAALNVGTGSTFTYTATTSGNPIAGYSLTTGPSGMTIDPVNGALSWTAPLSVLGTFPVTIKAANVLGSVSQSFTLNVVDRTPPTTTGNVVLTGVGKNSLSLSWQPATDNIGVTGYAVYWIYTTGHSGRGGGYTTHTILMGTTNASTTSITLNGLTQNTRYSLYVRAYDAAGNIGGYPGPLYATPGAAPNGLNAIEIAPRAGLFSYTLYDVANHQLTVQLSATSFAPPTYSLVSPPAGMTVDPNTGLLSWVPTVSNVGMTSVAFQATNPFGTTSLTLTINVAADVPVPGFVFTNQNSPTAQLVGYPVGLTISDGSNTPSTFTIDSGAPPGMTIDPVTGVVNWVPTQAGNPQVTFRLTNSAGTATLLLGPVIYVASPPRNLTMTGTDTWSPTLSWSPPAYNANLVASYRVWIAGGGLDYQFNSPGSTLSVSFPYLSPGTSYGINIQGLDAAGNQGNWAYVGFTFAPTTPKPGYSIYSNNGNPSIQAGQPVSIQLYDANTAYASTYSLVSGPAGVSVDPTYGTVNWTPTAAQIGLRTLVFRVTNVNTSVDVSVPFYVGPVTSDINPPSPSFTFTSNGGGTYAVAGQQMTMQVTDANTAQPSGFLLVQGPAGMTVDPNTGLVTWTSAISDIGTYVYPVIEDINTSGVAYLYPSIPVYFASAMNTVAASGSLATGTIAVAWTDTDPAAASEPIAGYDVYVSWVDSNGVTQFAFEGAAAAGSTGFSLTQPDPTVTTYTVYVTAFDSSGREGAMSSTGTTFTMS